MLIELLEQLVAIMDSNDNTNDIDKKRGDNIDFISIEHALRNPFEFCEQRVVSREPSFNLYRHGKFDDEMDKYTMAYYIYVINADEELFVIKSSEAEVHYPLFSILGDWYDHYGRILESQEDIKSHLHKNLETKLITKERWCNNCILFPPTINICVPCAGVNITEINIEFNLT